MLAARSLLLASLGLIPLFLAACPGPEFTVGDTQGTSTGATSSSSASSTGTGGEGGGGATSSGTGGAGGSECMTALDCPQMTCQVPACVSGECHYQPAAEGDPCNNGGSGVCTDGGACVQCIGVTDCPPIPCKIAVACDNLVCSYMNAPFGTLCNVADQCGDGGVCVDCVDAEGCIGDCSAATCICDNNTCIPN